MESSAGRIGIGVDQLLLYCYHYDPATGTYRLRGDERRQARRRGRPCCWRSSGSSVDVARREPAPQPGTDIMTYGFGIPLFPEQASTFADGRGRAVLLHRRGVGVLRLAGRGRWSSSSPSSITAGTPARSARRIGAAAAGADVDVIPMVIAMVMFVLGRDGLLSRCAGRPPRRWRSTPSASSGCGSSSTSRDSARSTSCTSRRPADQDHVTSEDVLHSLYFPAFRTKIDAIPGRYMELWFEATKPGTYHIFCAEYCGTKHSA